MSENPQAGTYRLDGMLQGPLAQGCESSLQGWADSAKASGLHFHLRIEGGTFSFVADPVIQRTSRLKGADLDSRMTDSLNAMLEIFPPQLRSESFSTLRSEEFRPGMAIQTLYPVGNDGCISPEQRSAEVSTGEANPELTPASIRRAVLPTLVALLLLLFVSTFFIDYKKLFSKARDRLAPLEKDELVVVQEAAEDLFSIKLNEVDNKRNTLHFTLAREEDWEAAMSASPADAMAMGWEKYTTILALRQGRLRIELYNKKGEVLATREVDVRGLSKQRTIKVAVVAHPKERISKVLLRP